MATFRLPIHRGLIPDSSGEVYYEASTVKDANDRFIHDLLTFKENAGAGTKKASGSFTVPQNYNAAGTTKVVLRWRTDAIINAVEWFVAYKALTDAESTDPSTDDQALSVVDTAAGTARLANTAEVTLTAANLAAGDTVLFSLGRDATDADDTLVGAAQLVAAWLEYTD